MLCLMYLLEILPVVSVWFTVQSAILLLTHKLHQYVLNLKNCVNF
jgi:hypothetical protein